MKINKALKKESKNTKRFFILMFIIFLLLPVLLLLSQIKSIFIIIYLCVLEILIIISCISKLNYHKLKFSVKNNSLKLNSGCFSKESIVVCDKVALVHTDKMKEDMEIILVTTSNFRNKDLKPITKTFVKKYPEASDLYIKIKRINPEKVYYYQIIKRGALKKYKLLDEIFKNCVKAQFTGSAIDNIKIAREQREL
jgi:hypothetical protein